MPVKMCSRQVVSRRLYVRSTHNSRFHTWTQLSVCMDSAHAAALNDHLRGDSDDDDDGADEDVAQTTDQTLPQDAAVTSEPTTRASDNCCEVCLINRKDPRIALVPCGHQRFCQSFQTVHQRGDRCPLCRADITMIVRLY